MFCRHWWRQWNSALRIAGVNSEIEKGTYYIGTSIVTATSNSSLYLSVFVLYKEKIQNALRYSVCHLPVMLAAQWSLERVHRSTHGNDTLTHDLVIIEFSYINVESSVNSAGVNDFRYNFQTGSPKLSKKITKLPKTSSSVHRSVWVYCNYKGGAQQNGS